MIAAMTYAKNNADISTMASLEVGLSIDLYLSFPCWGLCFNWFALQGVMGALYFGVGKALGSLVGGLAIEEVGVRNTFRWDTQWCHEIFPNEIITLLGHVLLIKSALTFTKIFARCFSLGSFVAASVYLCFTLLYGRRMRIAKEGEEEEGKKEASTDGKNDNEEEKGKEVTMSDKVNASVPELGGEGSRGTWPDTFTQLYPKYFNGANKLYLLPITFFICWQVLKKVPQFGMLPLIPRHILKCHH